MATTISSTDTVNIRKLKALRSSSGASDFCSRSWRSTNATSPATPTARATSAPVLGPPPAPWPPPIWLSPYTSPPNAGTVSTTDRKSSLALAVSPTFVR